MIGRREFMGAGLAGASLFTTPGLMAELLTRTPKQTEGPFYPNKLPLDTDNDLLLLNDQLTPAVGTIVHLSGRVMDVKGDPVRNAVVEIWQVDNNGVYLHSRSPNRGKWDGNFQGYGRFLTDAKGGYYFRTIKPVQYADRSIVRTPHIHVIVKKGAQRLITSQLYVKGHEMNAKDLILRGTRDAKARATLMVDYQPLLGSKIGELAGTADLIVGVTPEQ